jgi:hypothetical protein
MEVHRSFAQVAIHEDGITAKSFRLELEHDTVVAFGKGLRAEDGVVLEATGNTAAIVAQPCSFASHDPRGEGKSRGANVGSATVPLSWVPRVAFSREPL